MPHISKREWIKWPPEPESEPTSTLVLTSGSGKFVDIRVLKRDLPEGVEEDVLPLSRIDWAFAGTATTKQDPDSGGKRETAAWKHEIDSRTNSSELVKDEGEMFELGDGMSLETGKMVNPGRPDAGEVPYEELWRDVPALSVEELPLARLGSADGSTVAGVSPVSARVCVVMRLEDVGDRARGMVVRVGQYVQGIFKLTSNGGRESGTSTTVERWAWDSGSESAKDGVDGGRITGAGMRVNGVAKGGWQRQLRIGDYWLPCGFAMGVEVGKLRLGQEVEYGEFSWKVIELSYF